mmetsp:Transcript_52927/g.99423  ORF Transcript_52927/g.99423 Transcript_52927/m.99423 type:complete len:94 (+) Transcript_52927:77-358(+)
MSPVECADNYHALKKRSWANTCKTNLLLKKKALLGMGAWRASNQSRVSNSTEPEEYGKRKHAASEALKSYGVRQGAAPLSLQLASMLALQTGH